ncbi:hypothetical protein G7Y79_00024g056480 [Physcia stellaris]|nr:hypothetical protein G7Y79_00024g056480 [Physcia stellaris]
MTEPRARAARHKGQLNFESEIRTYLYAFGDVKDPLDETVRVLDELATDFVIETCHKANQVANLSGRQKVKDARKQFDIPEGKENLERGSKRSKKAEAKDAEKADEVN